MNLALVVKLIQGIGTALSAAGEIARDTKITHRPDGKVQTVTIREVTLYDRARVERRMARRAERRANRARDGR